MLQLTVLHFTSKEVYLQILGLHWGGEGRGRGGGGGGEGEGGGGQQQNKLKDTTSPNFEELIERIANMLLFFSKRFG